MAQDCPECSTRLTGIEAVVLKAGNRDLFYRRADGAAHLERVDGVVEVRYMPPANFLLFPLEVEKTWSPAYTRESPVARHVVGVERERSCHFEFLQDLSDQLSAGRRPET